MSPNHIIIQDFCGNNNNLFRLAFTNLGGRYTTVFCNIKNIIKKKVSVPKLAEGRN